DSGFDTPVGGQHDDRQVERARLHLHEEIEAVLSLEADVDDHRVDDLAFENLERRPTGLLTRDPTALMFQAEREEIAVLDIVVDDQHVRPIGEVDGGYGVHEFRVEVLSPPAPIPAGSNAAVSRDSG